MSEGTDRIYLDYASATPVVPAARDALLEAQILHGNPGALHAEGVRAKEALTSAREKIALELGCKAREVIFVSGGTEANNLAILGLARKRLEQLRSLTGTHWVVSSLEHPSVLECFSEIERLGGEVQHVDPGSDGVISPQSVLVALKPETELVSIAWANHEIGVLQPIRAIVRAAREHGFKTLFHSDAGQSPLYVHPQVHTLDVDLLSLDSGKLYGPRGIGALYVGARAELSRILFGGGQERGLRAGTENVALALGFAAAFTHVGSVREEEVERILSLRKLLSKKLQEAIPNLIVNGDLERSVPHLLNVSIPGLQCEYATLSLDRAGIAISTKSACCEGEEPHSHIVLALGDVTLPDGTLVTSEVRARHTLRFSLGMYTKESDIDAVVQALKEIVARFES